MTYWRDGELRIETHDAAVIAINAVLAQVDRMVEESTDDIERIVDVCLGTSVMIDAQDLPMVLGELVALRSRLTAMRDRIGADPSGGWPTVMAEIAEDEKPRTTFVHTTVTATNESIATGADQPLPGRITLADPKKDAADEFLIVTASPEVLERMADAILSDAASPDADPIDAIPVPAYEVPPVAVVVNPPRPRAVTVRTREVAPAGDVPFVPPPVIERRVPTKGTVSIAEAALRILRGMGGQSMVALALWPLVEGLGASSSAADPVLTLDATLTGERSKGRTVEKVSAYTWRWTGPVAPSEKPVCLPDRTHEWEITPGGNEHKCRVCGREWLPVEEKKTGWR